LSETRCYANNPFEALATFIDLAASPYYSDGIQRATTGDIRLGLCYEIVKLWQALKRSNRTGSKVVGELGASEELFATGGAF
jgi:hypothetical protein